MAFDFVAQVEKRMEALPISQSELASRLGVSEGAVSKLLNNPQNLTLRTVAKYSRALGLNASIVAYDNRDQADSSGPILSEVFTTCWNALASLATFGSWSSSGRSLQALTASAGAVPYDVGGMAGRFRACGFAEQAGTFGNSWHLPKS